MLAVSNTSPISNLASIGRLNLLRSQFSEIVIPEEVAAELNKHPDSQALLAIQRAISEQWIRVFAISNQQLLNALLLHLHSGEAEAIALAVELNASIVLLDEAEGRSVAAQLHLSVTGVLGILLRAKKDNQIPSVREAVAALRDKAGFFVAPPLAKKIIAAAGE